MGKVSMSDRIPVLICGDAGPGRHALLARGDLNVLWADSVTTATATLRHAQPKVCLVRPSHAQGDVTELVKLAIELGGPACVILIDEDERDDEAHWYAAGASEVLCISDAEAIMQLVGEYTGLAFAREQRAPFETVVEVEIDGEQVVLETVDISASGVAIGGFPDVAAGTLARVAFVVETQPIVLWARVVRSWNRGGRRAAGVRFVGASEEQRERLRNFVHAHNAMLPSPTVDVQNLFDDVVPQPEQSSSPLRAVDLVETLTTTQAAIDKDPDLAVLQQYLRTSVPASREALDMPPWLLRVADALTEVELAAAVQPSPVAWVRETLACRVAMARWRVVSHLGPPPTFLANRAYDLFVTLGERTEMSSDDVVAQIASIRATILRDLLSSPSTRRDARAHTSVPVSAGPPVLAVANG